MRSISVTEFFAHRLIPSLCPSQWQQSRIFRHFYLFSACFFVTFSFSFKRPVKNRFQLIFLVNAKRCLIQIMIQMSSFLLNMYRVFFKYCVFFKTSRKFVTSSSSPALGCYWLYKKLPANRIDCTLALR